MSALRRRLKRVMPLLVALATAGVLFMAALLAKANFKDFGASEDGIWFVTLVAMVLLVPASYFWTRFSMASAAAKEQLDRVLDSSQHGIISLTPSEEEGGDLVLGRMNYAAAVLLGLDKDEPAGCPARDILPDDILNWVLDAIGSGVPDAMEYEVEASRGARWLYLRVARMGEGAILSLGDISGRKADEKALRQSERELRVTAQIGKLGSWSVEYPGRHIYWSPEVRRLHAVGDDFIPDVATAINFYAPSSREKIERLFTACEREGTPYDSEFEFRDANGKLKWVRSMGEAEYDPATGKLKRIYGAFQDLTETHSALLALDESRQRLELAFWGGGMSFTDWHVETGSITFDKRWAATLGYEPGEFRETLDFWDSLIPEEDLKVLRQARDQCIAGSQETMEAEYRMRIKGGGYRWVLERSRVVEGQIPDHPVRVAGVLVDITKLKDVELKLEQALAHEKELAREAQSATKAKRDFLAVMSHEIRTPMNSILGFAELLAEADLKPRELEYVDTIRKSGESLLRIINDILEYTRLDAGRMPLECEPFCLREVIESTCALLEHSAVAKGIVLRRQVEDPVPNKVMGDAGRLKQVLVNLVSNAIKFTSKGVVSLGVDVAAPDSPTPAFTFAVHDTGVGIPQSKLEQIFEPFTQSNPSISRTHGGTGLGLSIAKFLVELMGGKLEVESTEGEGSTFLFTIPLGVQQTHALRNPEEIRPTDTLEETLNAIPPMKILVAEDDRVNARLTKMVLQKLGHSLTLVEDGAAAFEAAAALQPDVILMDIRMPQMDGIEATKRIRESEQKSPEGKRAFIIAFTADILPEAKESCLSAGMDAFLSKPLSLPMLSATLARAVDHP